MTKGEKWLRRQELIEEYKAIQKMFRHFDNLMWHVGAVLIGAIAVAGGLALGNPNDDTFFFLFWFSLVLMSAWLGHRELCAYWNRQGRKRLRQLEIQLDFHYHSYTKIARPKWYVVPATCFAWLLAVGVLMVLGVLGQIWDTFFIIVVGSGIWALATVRAYWIRSGEHN